MPVAAVHENGELEMRDIHVHTELVAEHFFWQKVDPESLEFSVEDPLWRGWKDRGVLPLLCGQLGQLRLRLLAVVFPKERIPLAGAGVNACTSAAAILSVRSTL